MVTIKPRTSYAGEVIVARTKLVGVVIILFYFFSNSLVKMIHSHIGNIIILLMLLALNWSVT